MPVETSRNGGRTRRGEDRRREIVKAAREVFSAQGYERAAMAEIAAKVGIVEGAIYKHFASKRELLFEATRLSYEPRINATKQQLAGIAGTRNRLRFVVASQLQAYIDDPGLCRVIIQEIRLHDDYYGSVVRELNREMTSLVLLILEQAAKQGELRADVRPTLVRDVVFGGIEHLAWKAMAGRGTLDVQAYAADLTELVLGGIENRPAQESSVEHELVRLREQVDRLQAAVDVLAKPPTRRGRTKTA